MFNFGIEAVKKFDGLACYGDVWLVEFYNYEQVIVVEDPHDSPDTNYVLQCCSILQEGV